jgi:hypothetical protein
MNKNRMSKVMLNYRTNRGRPSGRPLWRLLYEAEKSLLRPDSLCMVVVVVVVVMMMMMMMMKKNNNYRVLNTVSTII